MTVKKCRGLPFAGFGGVDHVGNGRVGRALVEAPGLIADGAVGGGHALALAKEFEPGFGDESFDEAFGVDRVAKNSPANGPVTHTDQAHFVHGRDESGGVFGANVVLDGDEDWAVFGMRLDGQLRRGAIETIGSEVGRRAAKQMVAAAEGNDEKHTGGGRDERFSGGGVLGEIAPERTASGEASPKDSLIDAEGASLNPVGNGELDRDVQGGGGGGPGKACGDEEEEVAIWSPVKRWRTRGSREAPRTAPRPMQPFKMP